MLNDSWDFAEYQTGSVMRDLLSVLEAEEPTELMEGGNKESGENLEIQGMPLSEVIAEADAITGGNSASEIKRNILMGGGKGGKEEHNGISKDPTEAIAEILLKGDQVPVETNDKDPAEVISEILLKDADQPSEPPEHSEHSEEFRYEDNSDISEEFEDRTSSDSDDEADEDINLWLNNLSGGSVEHPGHMSQKDAVQLLNRFPYIL